jgi:hypothetical protein
MDDDRRGYLALGIEADPAPTLQPALQPCVYRRRGGVVMPRDAVKLSPAHEEPPAWWEAEFHKRQNRARNSILRILAKAGRPLSRGELYSQGSFYGPEFDHAVQTLMNDGVVRSFVRHEPYSMAFGIVGAMIDRTYYELTEQP